MRIFLLIFSILSVVGTTCGQVKFDDYFTTKSMRLDYYHAGNSEDDYYFLDEVIEEPFWGGNKNYLVDDRNMGNQQFASCSRCKPHARQR